MELCCLAATATATTFPSPTAAIRRPSLILSPARGLSLRRLNPGLRVPWNSSLRASEYEEASYARVKDRVEIATDGGEDRGVVREEEETVIEYEEESAVETPSGDVFDFLKDLDLKKQLNSEDVYPILLYGTGAFVALWVSSAVVGALDALPLIPKVLEIIGLGYTIWFSYHYLIFKKNREELSAKVQDLKEQILGPSA